MNISRQTLFSFGHRCVSECPFISIVVTTSSILVFHVSWSYKELDTYLFILHYIGMSPYDRFLFFLTGWLCTILSLLGFEANYLSLVYLCWYVRNKVNISYKYSSLVISLSANYVRTLTLTFIFIDGQTYSLGSPLLILQHSNLTPIDVETFKWYSVTKRVNFIHEKYQTVTWNYFVKILTWLKHWLDGTWKWTHLLWTPRLGPWREGDVYTTYVSSQLIPLRRVTIPEDRRPERNV